jgi:hypothetical protein
MHRGIRRSECWVSKRPTEGPQALPSVGVVAYGKQTNSCKLLPTVQFCQIRRFHQSAYFQKGEASYRSMMTTSLR